MSASHTPGPWTMVEPVALDYRAPVIYGRDGGSRVATMDGGGPKVAVGSPEGRANARLIAAAPDLLANLGFAVKLLSALPGFSGSAQVETMRAAIAKATGQ